MKDLWISKKRSLLGLAGAVVLLVVIITSFMIGKSYEGLTIPTDSKVVPSHSFQPFGSIAKVPNVPQPMAPSASQNMTTTGGRVADSSVASSLVGQSTQSRNINPQYLIKTLNVDLQVKDTRKVADTLQTWITRTDPRATTSGTDYEQVSNNFYKVSLTFSVQATLYPQIYRYLRDYTIHNGGHLVTFSESIQDMTNTYVDTQSRLQNLRVEQARLQDLLSHAQTVSDIVSIDQQLTDVEGQIESYEAQLNTLTSQVTFYTVTVSLEPIETAINNGWSIGQVLHDAFSASLAFGQGVLGLVIWLLAFGFYIMPLVIVVWLGRKWYLRTRRPILPKVETEALVPENQ
jgi:hypothetical protein